MGDPWRHEISRRRLLGRAASFGAASAGLTAVAAACGALGPGSGAAQNGNKQLRILQWSHFVPAFDSWFDPFATDWGKKTGIDVTVDHISVDDIPARLAAEVAARGGHDLIQMNNQVLTYLYDNELLHMDDVVDYAVQKYGPVEPFGKAYCYLKDHWAAMPDYYIAISPQIRVDLFEKYGYDPNNVKTWEDYLAVCTAAKKDGHAAGMSISHCTDANHNWRAVMWAYGASEVKADGRTISVDTPEMRQFLDFTQRWYANANTPDVFAWDNSSDNKWLQSGTGAFIHDGISSMRTIETSGNTDLYKHCLLRPPVAGPAAPDGVANPDAAVYVIWKWSPNADAAKAFLKHYLDNWMDAFRASQLYDMPMYGHLYDKPIFTDQALGGQYVEQQFGTLQTYRGANKIHNFGYPGSPNYASNLVGANFVLPDMVGHAVKTPGKAGIQDAIDFAKSKLKLFYS